MILVLAFLKILNMFIIYMWIYIRASDFHSTYKQCSMPKQSYYLGETIQDEQKCVTLVSWLLQTSGTVNICKKANASYINWMGIIILYLMQIT